MTTKLEVYDLLNHLMNEMRDQEDQESDIHFNRFTFKEVCPELDGPICYQMRVLLKGLSKNKQSIIDHINNHQADMFYGYVQLTEVLHNRVRLVRKPKTEIGKTIKEALRKAEGWDDKSDTHELEWWLVKDILVKFDIIISSYVSATLKDTGLSAQDIFTLFYYGEKE